MFFGVLFTLFAVFLAVAVIAAVAENKKVAKMSPSQRAAYRSRQKLNTANTLYGSVNSAMICPHCQVSGKIHTKQITQKKGVSGGKATGALLTGGVSLLATGLSRKENNTQAHCRNCNNTWII